MNYLIIFCKLVVCSYLLIAAPFTETNSCVTDIFFFSEIISQGLRKESRRGERKQKSTMSRKPKKPKDSKGRR